MWFLPLLVIGALVVAASRSPREAPPLPQLALPPPPPLPRLTPIAPGPISVLVEYVRVGQSPPPTVILCAIAEAEAMGRDDIASDIIRLFVAPIVYQHEMATVQRLAPPVVYAPMPAPAALPVYAPPPYAPARAAPTHARGTREPSRSPRVAPVAPAIAPLRSLPPGKVPSTDAEIRALLNTDPERFIAMMTREAVPRERSAPEPITRAAELMTEPVVGPTATSSTAKATALAEQLLGVPGHASAGVVLDPATGVEIFEVRWLRGYPIPTLPQTIDGRVVQLVAVDTLPILHDAAVSESELAGAPPIGLPSEMVAQMQDAAGLHEAADQTRALAPGSPIAGVPDDAWRTFVLRLEREALTFSSSRHVGQYRQCRDRLVELDIDPNAILGSASAQRAALDADLANAYHHAVEGDLLSHVGRAVMVPGRDARETVTLSGLLGVIQCAGLDKATSWLERSSDRKRYPHTSQTFLRTNGVF